MGCGAMLASCCASPIYAAPPQHHLPGPLPACPLSKSTPRVFVGNPALHRVSLGMDPTSLSSGLSTEPPHSGNLLEVCLLSQQHSRKKSTGLGVRKPRSQPRAGPGGAGGPGQAARTCSARSPFVTCEKLPCSATSGGRLRRSRLSQVAAPYGMSLDVLTSSREHNSERALTRGL